MKNISKLSIDILGELSQTEDALDKSLIVSKYDLLLSLNSTRILSQVENKGDEDMKFFLVVVHHCPNNSRVFLKIIPPYPVLHCFLEFYDT